MNPYLASQRSAAAVFFALIATQSIAQSGSAELLVATTANVYSVQMGETTVTARGGSGTLTVVRGSGAPFASGISATVQFASFSKLTPSGFDLETHALATFPSGDTLQLLFQRKSGSLLAGTSAEGTLELSGDTGRLTGVSGQCKYTVENLAGNSSVAIAKCEWGYTFPYR